MELALSFIVLLSAVLSPLIFIMIGGAAVAGWRAAAARYGIRTEAHWLPSEQCVLGLLIFLLASFLLRSAGAAWWLSVLVPAALAIAKLYELPELMKRIRSTPLSLNFALWTIVNLIIGITLFQAFDAIRTPWVNSYGDLPFHLGMITSFTVGDNYPPEYHIFAGAHLSYPILINHWSASLWWPLARYELLQFIFLVQWLLLAVLIYRALQGDRLFALPWALLLAGGSFAAFGENSGQLKDAGVPWAVILTTIWVPQRSAWFGAAVLATVLARFSRGLYREPIDRAGLESAVFLLALMPLVHTHLFLVGAVFLGLQLLITAAKLGWKGRESEAAALLLGSGIAIIPAVLCYPLISGKESMVKLFAGWGAGAARVPKQLLQQSSQEILAQLEASAVMWVKHGGYWMAVLILALLIIKRRREALLILMLFLAANFVQLAVWEWDQIKVFLGIYIVGLALIAQGGARRGFIAQLLCLPLILPATLEVGAILRKSLQPKASSLFEVFPAEDVRLAYRLREVLPPKAVVAAAPKHVSPVLLTGRSMFVGYDGWLYSHGLDYGRRLELLRALEELPSCRHKLAGRGCPDFLLWSRHEREYWPGRTPREGFERFGMPELFAIQSK